MKNIQNTALQLANEIFSNGRIENHEDWDEMKLELEHEMNERGTEDGDRQIVLDTVKGKWYHGK